MTSVARRSLGLAVAGVAACGGAPRTAPLDPAGGARDEGAGLLARASVKLTLDTSDAPDAPGHPTGAYGNGGYGGAIYGDGMYGGGLYGGAASFNEGAYMPIDRTPHYRVVDHLAGAIEGVVSWTGAPPPRVATKCGAIDDPSVRVGADRGVGGVVVYIAQVSVGRAIQSFARSATVGGVVVKHGCALYPAAQVVAPLPAPLAIHGDADRAQLQITPPGGARTQVDLQEGGVVRLDAAPGVTRVAGSDGTLGAAWVIAVQTPYYAITDDAGHFRIDELAPGTYDLTFWQAPLATANAAGVITYGEPIVVHRTVVVALGKPAKLAVALGSTRVP